MMSSQRTATFRNQVGVGDFVTVGGIHEGIDTVVDILLDRVVDTTLTGRRTCAVVVDTQTTAAVDEVNVIAHLMQLHIELRGFAQSRLDTTDLRNLRTDMEMDESQTVFHILLL